MTDQPIEENPHSPNTEEDDQAGAEDEQPQALPVTDALDLHTIAPADLRDAVQEYLWAAMEKGFREVRIIHGKGIGVQKRIVASELERHPAAVSFRVAPSDRGHWGATIVQLASGLTRPPEDESLGSS